MSEPKLFILALYALRPDPSFTDIVEHEDGRITYYVRNRDGEMHVNSPIGLVAHMEIAESADEARQMGIEAAHELWPRADGWRGHKAVVRSHDLKQMFIALFGSLPVCSSQPEQTDDEEPEEMIM